MGLSDYTGPKPNSLFMDIDSSASTPILEGGPVTGPLWYLQYEITGLAYAIRPQAHALVIGPGGGRDLWTAIVAGARRVDGVEVNPIIVDDVMKDRFRAFSGDVYHAPGVSVVVDDGRSYVSRSQEQYDVIQASLVDTWAATSAGAYAMTENNLYTVEAFEASAAPQAGWRPHDHAVVRGRPAADVACARRRRAPRVGRDRSIACSPRATGAWRRSS